MFRRPAPLTALPSRYDINLGELRIRSDVRLDKDDPLLKELADLRQEIIATLELPTARRPVVVHLFENDERYKSYMQKTHPNLPARRAFFIGTATELAVYAHWGANIGEDLRHEYTHGILHASLKSVPLWLDEGLAEYFEIQTTDPGRRHPEHTPKLAVALNNGWRPDLNRLESLEDVGEMHRADYQEAWAWVHYLLHEAPDGRALLVDYCQTLRNSDKPPSFVSAVNAVFPDPESRLAAYISMSLTDQGIRQVSGREFPWSAGDLRQP